MLAVKIAGVLALILFASLFLFGEVTRRLPQTQAVASVAGLALLAVAVGASWFAVSRLVHADRVRRLRELTDRQR